MAEFSSLEPNQQIPTPSGRSVDGLGLTNPDSVLSGQNRGTQSIGGSANIQSDPSGQRLVVNDNTTNRVAFGRIGTGVNDWGMKVSKAGVPVDTATASQLIFNSSQDVLKVVSKGTITTASIADGAQLWTTVAHGLNFAPIPFVFWGSSDGYSILPITLAESWGTGGTGIRANIIARAYTNETNLLIEIINANGASVAGYTFTYFLMQESIT